MDFRRIIQNGKFIPEVDGLRFIAIGSVLLYHIQGFLFVKNQNIYKYNFENNYVPDFILNGSLGVELFFVISGFILGLFFAKAYILGKEISHKSYFIRRLTRLEPPYIIIMIILFVFSVFLLKRISFDEGIKSLLCSLSYSHNIFFGRGKLSPINSVVWSLEVEVQFYILAPIFGLLFKLKGKQTRRAIFVILAIVFSFLGNFYPLPFISLFDYIEYFLLGFLLVDLYVVDVPEKIVSSILSVVCIISLFVFFRLKIVKTDDNALLLSYYTILQLLSLFLLFKLVVFAKSLPILKNAIITNIGGACYTIYLIHYPVISAVGNKLVKYQFTQFQLIDSLIYGVILCISVLLISAMFFLFIERPCMDSNWYKKIKIPTFNFSK